MSLLGGRRPAVLALVESNTTGTGRMFAAAARSAGLRPVLISRDPGRYPWAATDAVEVAVADTSDTGAVVAAATALGGLAGVAGVLTSSEYSVGVAAAAAARLGLPGPAVNAVSRCRDKRQQRALLDRAGVSVPAFTPAFSPAEAVAAGERLGFPVVCKPVDGTGSRGVRHCPDRATLEAHARALLEHSVDERGRPCQPFVLVEEFVDGPEVSVETFGGRLVGVTAKHLGTLPWFVEIGHDYPATGPAAARAADLALAAVEALGVGWGPAHTEVRLGPDGPAVVEVNPRLAGGRIPVLIRLATGVDLVRATVSLAVTGRHELALPVALRPGAASIRFLVAAHASVMHRAADRAAAAAVPGVVDVAVDALPGVTVGGTGSFLDRVGYVTTAGESICETAVAAERALAALDVVFRPNETCSVPPLEVAI